MFKKRRRWLAIGATAIIVLALWAWIPWAKYRYHGDGTFTDSGFFSYPRYEVRFASIPLSKVGEYPYHFRGLPNEEMTLLLSLNGGVTYDSKQWHELLSLHTKIETVLKDGRGREVCKAAGSPEDGNRDGIWVLTSGSGTAFWHWKCHDVHVHPRDSYELLVRVSEVDSRSEKFVVTPMLEGGGMEFP
jgi:hypothetical protein